MKKELKRIPLVEFKDAEHVKTIKEIDITTIVINEIVDQLINRLKKERIEVQKSWEYLIDKTKSKYRKFDPVKYNLNLNQNSFPPELVITLREQKK